MTPKEIYHDHKATKATLRAALGQVLGISAEPEQPKQPNVFKECLTAFQNAYKKQTGLHYQLSAKDAVSMAGIIKKFHGLNVGSENIVEAFTVLLAKLPEWYRQNAFSLPVINGKFNEIVAAIRQSNDKKTSYEYKERIARDLTGR